MRDVRAPRGRALGNPIRFRHHDGRGFMAERTGEDVIRRFNVEVIRDGNRATFDELMAPDFVNRSAPPVPPWGPRGCGTRSKTSSTLSGLDVIIHDQVAEGDKVTTRKTITGMHAGALMGDAPTGRVVDRRRRHRSRGERPLRRALSPRQPGGGARTAAAGMSGAMGGRCASPADPSPFGRRPPGTVARAIAVPAGFAIRRSSRRLGFGCRMRSGRWVRPWTA